MTSRRTTTLSSEEMDALLERAHDLRAAAAARQFAALGRLLRRAFTPLVGVRQPACRDGGDARARRDGGCVQAA